MEKNMLSIPIPSSPNLTKLLTTGLRQSILSHAGETHHPDAFASDISALAQLRAQVASMEAHTVSLDAAYRYYAQLIFVTTKLPSHFPLAFPWSQPLVSTSLLSLPGSTAAKSMVDEDPSEASSSTSKSVWDKDGQPFALIYQGTAYVAHPLLIWEQSNVLFAIAALLSQLGLQEPRNDGQSIKRAVGYFQTSSAIFSYLESSLQQHSIQFQPTSPPHGLTSAAIKPLATLTLAQAQECFWQKALSDGMKAGTVAKLAKAVEDLYEQTHQEASAAQDEQGREALSRTWMNHITTKRYHFAAACQYRKSQEDVGNSRYGDEIARLQLAEQHVKSALSALKKGLPSSSSSTAVVGDLKGLQGVIESNLKRACKDNDLIYLEPVTPSASLAVIQGARMVQPKLPVQVSRPIDCLQQHTTADDKTSLPALGKPLFGALVPYGAHLAISVYEDRKETWWRESMENKRMELEGIVKSTLDSLNLPFALDALDRDRKGSGIGGQQGGIPQSLLSAVDLLHSQGGLSTLHALHSEVLQKSSSNAQNLSSAREALEVESQEDSAMRAQQPDWGSSGRMESRIAAQDYWKRYEELSATVKMAEQSDSVVQGKISQWSEAWSILQGGQEEIAKHLPKRNDSDTTDQDHALTSSSSIVRSLRTTLESIDDTLSEYAALSSESKAVVQNDDIREKVMREVARLTSSSSQNGDTSWGIETEIQAESFEDLFQSEFTKYRTIQNEIVPLSNKIHSLLETLSIQSETFSKQLKSQSTYNSSVNSLLTTLSTASNKYTEVYNNLREGNQFYSDLETIILEFLHQVKEWKRSREVEVQFLVQQSQSRSNDMQGRKTRPKTRQQHADESGEEEEEDVRRALESVEIQSQSQSNGQQQQQQQWGQWSGGAIRFSD
ncbi:unnamed protein product [Sympodiomycopsis kandeliae]